jgi:predicted permease
MIRPGIRSLFALPAWWRRRPTDDVDDEIRSHFELRAAQLRASGLTAAQAEAEVRRRFGPFEPARAQLHTAAAARNRQLRLAERFDALRLDVRYTLRGLWNTPAFSAGVIVTLALGVGVNSAVFRVLDRLLFRPPAGIADAKALLHIRAVPSSATGGSRSRAPRVTLSYPQAHALETVPAFRGLAMYTPPRIDTLADGREVAQSTIGPGYMELAGVRPALGRFFTDDELRPMAGIRSIILSYAFWQREFGGDRHALEQTVTFAGTTYRVVGIAAPPFAGVDLNPVDLWTPLGAGRFGHGTVNGVTIAWYELRGLIPLSVVVRLRPGVSAALATTQAQARLSADENAAGVGAQSGTALSVLTFAELQRVGRSATGVEILTRVAGVAALILVLTCANTTNLLLLRGRRRRREIAVRLAMGIGRARLARQIVTETVMLTGIGAGLAALASYWVAAGIRALLFPEGRWVDSGTDSRSLVFTGIVSLAVVIIVSLAPVLQSQRTDIGLALKGTWTAGRSRRGTVRESLVVVQAALSIILLIGAGLFIRSLQRLGAVDLGLDPSGLVAASIYPDDRASLRPGSGLRTGTASDIPSIQDLERLARTWPGITATTLTTLPPFDATRGVGIVVPGVDDIDAPGETSAIITGVTPEYFTVMRLRLLRGRLIGATDSPDAPRVVVVNRTMAQRLWPSADPLGQCIKIGGENAPCSHVIGVVEDMRDNPAAPTAPRRYYVSLAQATIAGVQRTLILRASQQRDASAAAARLLRLTVAGTRPVVDLVQPRIDANLREWRTGTALFGLLGILAVALAGVGLASVLMYSVNERLHEIGVRMALGASGGLVVRSVLGAGLALVGVGLAIGVGVALLAARTMSAVVFDVSVFDGRVYLLSTLALLAVAVAAALLPSARAARVDPVIALRSE